MDQQRDNYTQGVRTSSQTCRDDEETCSNKATSGSSDTGPNCPGRTLTRSPSPDRGLDMAAAGPEIPSSRRSSFIGLTLDPLPPAMLPTKKRPLEEVLNSKTPPREDKMSAEIEKIAREGPILPCALPASSLETQDAVRCEAHRHKRSKANEEPPALQEFLIATRDSAGDPDTSLHESPERRLERVPTTSRRSNGGTSD